MVQMITEAKKKNLMIVICKPENPIDTAGEFSTITQFKKMEISELGRSTIKLLVQDQRTESHTNKAPRACPRVQKLKNWVKCPRTSGRKIYLTPVKKRKDRVFHSSAFLLHPNAELTEWCPLILVSGQGSLNLLKLASQTDHHKIICLLIAKCCHLTFILLNPIISIAFILSLFLFCLSLFIWPR
jgi:hypothetical protein